MTQRHNKGFTLIELMLAMSFVSMLLLAIVMTAIQAGRMYNRGIVLGSVNQAGRDITVSLRRDFLQAPTRTALAVKTVKEGEFASSRLCLGNYSYLWNSPEAINQTVPPKNNKAIIYDANNDPINFVRVVDENGAYCLESPAGGYINTLPADPAATAQLLKTQSNREEVVLAVHDLVVQQVAAAGSQELYRVTITLGTSKLEEINTANATCKPPANYESNLEFCAINQFDMIVRKNG